MAAVSGEELHLALRGRRLYLFEPTPAFMGQRWERVMGDAITKLKTSEELLKNLSGTKKPSPDEVNAQRVSFVYGSLDSESPITREQVRQALECA